MARDGCNYFSLWAIFYPFTLPPKSPKNRNLKKKKKNAWRYHHFTYLYQKLWSDDVQFLRYGAQRMDGLKKWHIEVGAPPKNGQIIRLRLHFKYQSNENVFCSSIWKITENKDFYKTLRTLKTNTQVLTKINSWYEEGSEVPPVIQDSKVPSFSISVSQCTECLNTPSIENPHYMAIPSFYIFSKTALFGKTFLTMLPQCNTR